MFTQVHQNLEHGSFRDAIKGTGWPRTARILIFEEGVLHAMNKIPDTSVRVHATDLVQHISNNCPSCTAGRSLSFVSCVERAVVTARRSRTTCCVCLPKYGRYALYQLRVVL
ncbi:hypothetical protein TNCV_4210561 [Trichonephila clavipes]|nr:hypothetical protein TNCV_4210561 [Trichonephila clavipes]